MTLAHERMTEEEKRNVGLSFQIKKHTYWMERKKTVKLPIYVYKYIK